MSAVEMLSSLIVRLSKKIVMCIFTLLFGFIYIYNESRVKRLFSVKLIIRAVTKYLFSLFFILEINLLILKNHRVKHQFCRKTKLANNEYKIIISKIRAKLTETSKLINIETI